MRDKVVELPSARVRLVEREWPKHVRRRELPMFWTDEAVRRAAIDLWSTMTLDQAVAAIGAQLGVARAPSRSAIGRFWRVVDRVMKAA